MPTRTEIVIGTPRELQTTNKLLAAFDVSVYDELRIVVDNIGGSDSVQSVTVDASVDSDADSDLDISSGWVQIASRDDFAPSKKIANNDGASIVVAPVLWAQMRVSATKVTAVPAPTVTARASIVGIIRG
mgnify:FL=1